MIESIATEMDSNSEITKQTDISDLINLVRKLNVQYFDWCTGIDDEYDQPHGTTYEDGISLEYYIEAEDMHKLSKLLRKIK